MSKETTKSLEFNNISASTKTFVMKTNLTIDIEQLFQNLPITSYIIIPKKRGRKKKNAPENPNKDISDGSIITLGYKDKTRGVDLKKKKKNSGHITYFRNATSVVMIIQNKIIDFKISKNGKFQMTGCKFRSQAEKCIHYIWTCIINTNYYKFENETDKHLKVMFIPSMRNIDFDIGFHINRESLDHYINTKTDYRSLLETSIGYTGVNIKFPFTKSILDIKIKQRDWINSEWQPIELVSYNKYLDTENPKDRKKKLDKKRYTTFLVFHSGKTIMSCIDKDFGRDHFYDFINILHKNRNILEEKLDKIIN